MSIIFTQKNIKGSVFKTKHHSRGVLGGMQGLGPFLTAHLRIDGSVVRIHRFFNLYTQQSGLHCRVCSLTNSSDEQELMKLIFLLLE